MAGDVVRRGQREPLTSGRPEWIINHGCNLDGYDHILQVVSAVGQYLFPILWTNKRCGTVGVSFDGCIENSKWMLV